MESARVENDFGGVLPPLVFDSLDMILDTASRVIGVGLRCDIGVTLKKLPCTAQSRSDKKLQAQANVQGYRARETVRAPASQKTEVP